MSKGNFQKFCHDYIPKHPELGLVTDDLTPEAFTKVAVAEGQKAGFSFTAAEVEEVMGEHRKLATRKPKAEGTVVEALTVDAGIAERLAVDPKLVGKKVDLSAAMKASVNGTAMCYYHDTSSEDADADWIVIKDQ
jgi:hypothetical protein